MSSKKSEKLFALILVKKGRLTPEELKVVMTQKGSLPLDHFLLKKGILSVADLEQIWEEAQHQKKCFGPYEIQEKLAKGAMGEVYKVKHLHLHQTYAMKVMLPHQNQSEEMVARFQQEAQIIAKLQHPYIVQVVDSGKIRNRPYLCMEYVEGCTLEDWIQKEPQLNEGIELFCKILEALEYAHHQGVIHRDIKPGNIFVTKEGIPKIGDFGLSKFRNASENAPKTVAGEFLGTPAYMAPEQAAGESEPRSDLYSVAACLYRFLTLRCPFESDSLQKLFYLLITEEPPLPSKWNPKITKDLEAIVLKGLQKRKEKRYQSAKSFKRDLLHFLAGEPVLARTTPKLERSYKWLKRHRKQLLLGIFCLGILLSVWSYASWRNYQQKKQQVHQLYRAYQFKKQEAEFSLKSTNREKTFFHFLETFDKINLLLHQNPKNIHWLKEKTDISEQIIQLACSDQEYGLASYLVSDLKVQNSEQRNTIEKLEQHIQHAQEKQLTQHLHRFNFWKQKLQQEKLDASECEQAIFEISKMEEPEIVASLLTILKEGLTYFSDPSRLNSSLSTFYQTMALALGRLEKKQTAFEIYSVLQEMFLHIRRSSVKSSLAEVEYMISLAQALSYTQAPGFAKKLEDIRLFMGQSSLFWKRTQLASRLLVQVDGIFQVQENQSAETMLENANIKYLQKDWQGALADFKKLLTVPECSAQAYNGCGLVRIALKEYEQAILDFNRAIRIDSQTEFYNNRGLAKHHLGDYTTAIEDYSYAIQLSPNSFDAYLNRAVARRLLGNDEGAYQDYNAILQRNPSYSDAYLNRGIIRRSWNDFEGALQDFNQIIQLDPKSAEAYFHRGMTKKHQKDFQGALADHTQSIRLRPGYAKPYVDRGNIKKILGDLTGAMRDYDEGIRLDPTFAMAYHDRAIAKLESGSLESALQDLQEAIRLDPKKVAFYNNRGTVWYSLKKYKQAIEDYSSVLEKDPTQLQAYYNRGLAYYELGQPQKAQQDFLNFLKRLPQNSLNARQAREHILQIFPELKTQLSEFLQPAEKDK